jgi:hypothetical protein
MEDTGTAAEQQLVAAARSAHPEATPARLLRIAIEVRMGERALAYCGACV